MPTLDEIGAKLTAGRDKTQELSDVARAAILGAVAGGANQAAIATAFGTSRQTVSKIVQRFKSSGTLESKPRSGRPEIFTARDKRHILQAVKRQPGTTTSQLVKSVGGSRSTVFRLLAENKRQNKSGPRASKLSARRSQRHLTTPASLEQGDGEGEGEGDGGPSPHSMAPTSVDP